MNHFIHLSHPPSDTSSQGWQTLSPAGVKNVPRNLRSYFARKPSKECSEKCCKENVLVKIACIKNLPEEFHQLFIIALIGSR